MFYSNKENNTNKSDNTIDYFSNINCKYIELVTYILIILILIVKSFMMYFKLIKKKYISHKKDNNKLTAGQYLSGWLYIKNKIRDFSV